jgi:predicted DsbA family dithiol-disulfide isomerase
MPTTLRIDFVSDIACPWCAVGLHALQIALMRLGDAVSTELHFQPFELNPQMVAEGEDTEEHLARKYGGGPEKRAQMRELLRQRGAEVGFEFRLDQRSRIYNTLDAHRLLHWAGTESAAGQLALKQALLRAYFTEGRNPSDAAVLTDCAHQAGLDAAAAAQVLARGEYAADVRTAEQRFLQQGIQSVPATIINGQYLISGGQPADAYEGALREILGKNSGA